MHLTDRALSTLKKRIFAKDANGNIIEDFDGMCKRVADFIGNDDTERKSFYDMIHNLDFVPNSPCLVNAGVPKRQNQLSACFVLTVEDSIDGIFDMVKEAAIIHKTGGGTGFDFSKIRPKNSLVQSTAGVASGPVSFMHVFDSATEAIKQGGVRRGANMGVLRVDHPDIMDFINAKSGKNALKNFNISVAITDEFMKALYYHEDYDCIDPKTGDKVKMNAKKVWDAIVNNAWATADPGILFIDRINEHNPLVGPEHVIAATNPCVIGQTLILTEYGYRQIGSLVNKTVNIWNGFEFSQVVIEKTGENQRLMRIEFSDGNTIICTPSHKFLVQLGSSRDGKILKLTANNLRCGDKLAKCNFPVLEGIQEYQESYMYTRGFFSGDGSSETGRDRNSIWLYGEKKKLIDYLEYEQVTPCDGDRIFVKMLPSTFNKKYVPTIDITIKSRLHWLAGLLDAGGSVSSDGVVNLWSVDKKFLLEVSRFLNCLGVSSKITLGKEKQTKNIKGTDYNCEASWRLIISAHDSAKLVNLGLNTHRLDLSYIPSRNAKQFVKVVSVEHLSYTDDVYCCTEYKNNTIVINGIMTGNCGEQPLAPNEACGLGSINLTKFVNHGEIDFDRLAQVTKNAVLFLNRMTDKSEYPNETIKNRVLGSRKIGLGVMGVADMFIMLKHAYNAPEALEIAEDVIKCILDNSVIATHELGLKEGTFEFFEDYHAPKHIREALNRTGIRLDDYKPRNSALLTIAPTGTISMIANVSSGIEPVFYFEQVERRMDTEIIHKHPLYEAFVRKYPKLAVPHYFKQMDQIDVATHIKMQATFQQYICSGVSKTVNLPADATRSDVEQSFKEAFMLGCKGVTVYRDGCLNDQVISKNGSGPVAFVYPEERPKALNGSTHAIKTGYGNMLVTVNSKDGLPFEVICQIGKGGGSEAAKAEAVGRLVSTMLRCRIPVSVIVEQLEGIVGSESVFTEYGLVKSIPDALAKILMNHVLDDNNSPKITVMRKCKDCGASPLHVEGSCLVCQNCGWKSCGG